MDRRCLVSASLMVSAILVSTLAQAKPKVQYRFEEGKAYAYRIQIEAELGEKTLVTQAGCNYSVAKADKTPATPATPQTATGTAFVVHPDGYLLTCEHVVEGAQKIEVALGGKKYAGTVVVADAALDLAILKIEARSLPVLPLGNSAGVQVGQEVRAIGYPLSSVLGSSLKATRGSVSGIDQFDGQRTFQIDASVNGGNSGGPLVTESGDVVGVVNAKLAGAEISNVGFAVPVDYAKRLLTDRKVQFTAAKGSEKLDGPALVKKVDPCVALVTVTVSPEAAGDMYNLRAAGHINRSERQKKFTPGQRPTLGPAGSNVFFGARTPVELKVDSAGGIHEFNGTDSLPLMLGYAPLLIFEPLPTDGRSNWETRQQIVLEGKSGDKSQRDEPGFGFGRPSFGPRGPIGPRGFPGPRFGPGGRGDQPSTPQTTQYPAMEVVKYSIAGSTGDLVTITKDYELKTIGADKSLQLETTGTGTITFDTKAGVPRKFDYKGTLSVTQGQVTVKVPFTAGYELSEGKPPQTAASTPKPTPPATATPQPSPPAVRPAPSATPAPEAAFVAVGSNPNLAVRASKTYRKETPDLAFDGDPKTHWGAGGWPLQWIEADLKQVKPLTALKLTLAQSTSLSPGETEHEVWISDSPLGEAKTNGKLIHTFRGTTNWGDVLQFAFPAGTSARYVQIRSIKSRAWIAWGEIDIEAGK